MVAATANELSPVVTALIYCSVIEVCREVFAVSRAREWTWAMANWCEAQPQLVAYNNVCLMHRAEILILLGEWDAAVETANTAMARHERGVDPRPPAAAMYQVAEVQRLRGDFPRAEETFRMVGRWGRDTQPGLALLRLAQGRDDDAVAAIRTTLESTRDSAARARLLPAYVEIMLAAGDVERASGGAEELSRMAETVGTDPLRAFADHAAGALALRVDDPAAALVALRRAAETWKGMGARYQGARARELLAVACERLDDLDGAALHRDAARAEYDALGAAPDSARLSKRGAARPHGLTPREREVLALLAAGQTNKAIAADLMVSERTVDRHVSNIFLKLSVSTRAAATAHAIRNGLV
jgi:DNA-binding CsgD family transcriptional regulator